MYKTPHAAGILYVDIANFSLRFDSYTTLTKSSAKLSPIIKILLLASEGKSAVF